MTKPTQPSSSPVSQSYRQQQSSRRTIADKLTTWLSPPVAGASMEEVGRKLQPMAGTL